ncbi:MAG: Maf family protein [Alphaproteobacteria bacterium]|nr:Maf family protein [Alphaproteobacteria bacterium]
MTIPVLASGSVTRRDMLQRAGVPVLVDPARIDEAALRDSLLAEGADAARAAEALAEVKALQVSARHPGALVLGADQMLDCEGTWVEKPADRAAARAQLLALRGRRHTLISAVVAVRDGQRVWHAVERARLTMRPFGEDFLDAYLERAGDDVLSSVGAYRIEELGIQLFARIEGDHATILGLPLLPLLDFLRDNGVIGR